MTDDLGKLPRPRAHDGRTNQDADVKRIGVSQMGRGEGAGTRPALSGGGGPALSGGLRISVLGRPRSAGAAAVLHQVVFGTDGRLAGLLPLATPGEVAPSSRVRPGRTCTSSRTT